MKDRKDLLRSLNVHDALQQVGRMVRAASVLLCLGLSTILAHAACSTTYTLVAGSSASLVGTPLSACTMSGSTITCTQDVTVVTNNLCILTSSSSLTIALGSNVLNWSGNSGVFGSSTNPINLTALGINVDGNSFTSYGNWTATGAVNCNNTNSQTALYGSVSGSPNSCTPYVHAVTQTCLTDAFASGTLDTSVWNVSGVGYTPVVVTSPTVPSNRLRLTNTTGYEATFAQFKKWFPGAGNKVVVEFDYYVWGGSGADGLSVVLSDASVPPTPGASGGSLGYAQKTGVNGFGGGWLGIALDEFGNFPNVNEGRNGYPTGWVAPAGANFVAKQYANSVSIRGSGSATTGFFLLATSGSLATKLWQNTNTSATTQRFRITVDHSNSLNAYVSVERDLTGTGNSYASIIPAFDVRAANSGQAAVPANMMLSFTGGTGGSTNNHEIANVRVCATTMNPVGGAVPASNFECMDGYLNQANYNNRQTTPAARNPIYTKLARTGFNLRVVPLASDGSFQSNYIPAGGSSKSVTVEVFDASGATPATCSAYSGAVASQTVTLASGVDFVTGNFTINKAYPKLMCRVTDNAIAGSPVYGCSSDQFAVRPGAVTLTTTATAAAPSPSATPAIKAGSNFTLRATTSTNTSDVYSGTLNQNSGALTAQITTQSTSQASGGVVGGLTPANLIANAAAVNATYSEVGYLYLAAGAYQDTSYTAVDQVGDCVANNTSIALSGGKYGCVIATTAAVSLGRFYPDHFALVSPVFTPGCGSTFTYMGQPFTLSATVQAQNTSGSKTSNFNGVFATANVVPELEDANSGTAVDVVRLTGLGTPVWAAGEYPFVATGFSRPTPPAGPDGPFDNLDIGLKVVPVAASDTAYLINRNMASANTSCTADTTGTSNGTCTAQRVATAAKLRFGRLRLQNAYGSELLALDVPIQAQYYDAATASFKPNADDACTTLSLPPVKAPRAIGAALDGTAGMYFYTVDAALNGKNKLAIANTTPTLASPLTAGKSNLHFSKPSNRGWLDVILQVPSHLLSDWGNCGGQSGTAGLYDDLPCARATFGIYNSPLIYRRENY